MYHGGSSECWPTPAGRWCICWQVPAGHRYSLVDRSKVMGTKPEIGQNCASNRPSDHRGGLRRASSPCCSFSISKQRLKRILHHFLSNTNTFIFNIYFWAYSGIQDKNLSVIFLYKMDRNDKHCSLSRAKAELSCDTNHLYLLKILFSVLIGFKSDAHCKWFLYMPRYWCRSKNMQRHSHGLSCTAVWCVFCGLIMIIMGTF